MEKVSNSVLSLYRKVKALIKLKISFRIFKKKPRWSTLRSISKLISYTNKSHDFYISAINTFDQDVALLQIDGPKFIGRGHGRYNLNAYRTGKYRERYVFEKIYLIDSDSWKKIKWVYNKVLNSSTVSISTPKIIHLCEGRELGVVYFEYISNAKHISIEELMATACNFKKSVMLYREILTDDFILDFRRDIVYQHERGYLKRIFIEKGLETCKIENIV